MDGYNKILCLGLKISTHNQYSVSELKPTYSCSASIRNLEPETFGIKSTITHWCRFSLLYLTTVNELFLDALFFFIFIAFLEIIIMVIIIMTIIITLSWWRWKLCTHNKMWYYSRYETFDEDIFFKKEKNHLQMRGVFSGCHFAIIYCF